MKLTNDTQVFKGNTPWNGKIFRGDTLIWPVEYGEYETQYLTIEIVSGAGQSGEFIFEYPPLLPLDIEFSKNNGSWVSYSSATAADKSVVQGDAIRVRGHNNTYTYYQSEYESGITASSSMLVSGGCNYEVYGNIMSLIYGDDFIGKKTLTSANTACFRWLFNHHMGASIVDNNDFLINVENLILPARTLSRECYAGMFNNCQTLEKAPELPATSLAEGCYMHMFFLCKNLQYIKCMAVDLSAHLCTWEWVYYVSPTGTFIKHPNATWETGGSGIPSGWTVQDAVL